MPASIQIIDELSPENVAMLQALLSRSNEAVEVHLERILRTGSTKFMETYYVGYNHKSIADCGSTTVFLRGVSILAAKALQDWALYCGQETSTRYIDMTAQPIVDPLGTEESKAILAGWMQLYRDYQDEISASVRHQHPRRAGEDEKAYEGAVKARTFDIARCLLPAGVTTQLSWHTNLRQAGDHLPGLIHHPLEEVRRIGAQLREALGERYPSSLQVSLPALSGIVASKGAAAREAWVQQMAADFTYLKPIFADEDRANPNLPDVVFWTDVQSLIFNDQYLEPYREVFATRPRGCVLPHWMSDFGQLHFDCLLDYGSFRDAQRHRNGVCRMPLLTTTYGFDTWYLEQLGTCASARKILEAIEGLRRRIDALACTPEVKQYYIALGYRVTTSLSYPLPAAVYVMELRSGRTIHPTLRRKAHKMVDAFTERHPIVTLHADRDPDDWGIRRGLQTISARP